MKKQGINVNSKLSSRKIISSTSEKGALWLIALVTLFITPGLTYDPINVPKFLTLGVGVSVLSILSWKGKELKALGGYRLLLILTASFAAILVSASIFSKSNISSDLFGSPGRQTGLISYLCLILVLIYFSMISTESFSLKVNGLLILLGFSLSLYGTLQFLGLEIFPYGNAYGSSVFGTFGNSNFLSAFLGMASVAGGLTAMNFNFRKKVRLFGLATFATSILTIYLSNSQQGFLIIAAGLGAGLILDLLRCNKFFTALAAIILYVAGALLASLGFFNIGPVAPLVYQSSLGLRKEYWFAAFQMMKEEPIFGVGLDNFGSFFRRSRSADFAKENPSLVTDSAHNVFLDLGSGGGILVLVMYVAIISYAFIRAYKVLRLNDPKDYVYVILLSVWIAYLVQSFISINNLGLAIWGWVLPGLLIGYQRPVITTPLNSQEKKASIQSKVIITVGIMLGLLTIPTFISSAYFYSTLKTGNPDLIKNSAFIFPDDLNRYVYVATALQNNQFQIEAKEVLLTGVQKFPDSYDLWRLYSESTVASQAEITKARIEMKRLDPNIPSPR